MRLGIREKPSGWKFKDSTNASLSVDVIAALGGGKGSITLQDPTGSPVKFYYGYGGAGFGVGAKVSIGSPVDTDSVGRIYITDSFRGDELRAEDIAGGCLFIEASIGIGEDGASATAMLLGVDLKDMHDELASDLGQLLIVAGGGSRLQLDAMEHFGWFKSSAKAILLMAGFTTGFNFGAGVMGNVGFLWQGAPKDFGELVIEHPSTVDGQEPPVRISQKIQSLIMLPGDVLFDFDKDVIKPSAGQELLKAAAKIRSHPNRRIQITGYTDSVGSKSYNKGLSERRANSVKNWLAGTGAASFHNMTTRGYGEAYPVASNKTSEGRRKNRRVEIMILSD